MFKEVILRAFVFCCLYFSLYSTKCQTFIEYKFADTTITAKGLETVNSMKKLLTQAQDSLNLKYITIRAILNEKEDTIDSFLAYKRVKVFSKLFSDYSDPYMKYFIFFDIKPVSNSKDQTGLIISFEFYQDLRKD